MSSDFLCILHGLLLALSFIGLCATARNSLKLDRFVAPFFTACSIIVLLMLGGMLRVLPYVFFAVYIGGFAGLVWTYFVRRVRPDFALIALLAAYAIYLVLRFYPCPLFRNDDVSHWGLVARYLLRHETATCEHYARLHPSELTLGNRIRCLNDLKSLGYQVGCGFMVESPYQTEENLAADLKFIEEFSPEMCGIGPFIPHIDTPFRDEKAGSAELTCYLLSIIRIMKPNILLPATTALGSIAEDGRLKGILSGANVVMPNLSPYSVRKKYSLYNNKLHTGAESAEALDELKRQVASIGYEVVTDKGNYKEI